MIVTPTDIWNQFCAKHRVAADAVPLFETDCQLEVATKPYGKKVRELLCRSHQMDNMLVQACDMLIGDWETAANSYDGLIYIMCYLDGDNVVPLYVGKTETFGKKNRNLSENIRGVSKRRTDKFARWGDNYEYHIGDLSAVVLGHPEDKQHPKYRNWAANLFVMHPVAANQQPVLKRKVYFWAKPWSRDYTGPWTDFGPTSLTFLEYLLIGVASAIFPDYVLNHEGQNRGR